jgi:hypothetical protein
MSGEERLERSSLLCSKTGKHAYKKPVLIVFGTVRELTGGSGGTRTDAGGTMPHSKS